MQQFALTKALLSSNLLPIKTRSAWWSYAQISQMRNLSKPWKKWFLPRHLVLTRWYTTLESWSAGQRWPRLVFKLCGKILKSMSLGPIRLQQNSVHLCYDRIIPTGCSPWWEVISGQLLQPRRTLISTMLRLVPLGWTILPCMIFLRYVCRLLFFFFFPCFLFI